MKHFLATTSFLITAMATAASCLAQSPVPTDSNVVLRPASMAPQERQLRVISMSADWRSAQVSLPWSEPVIVKDAFGVSEPTVFDKNYQPISNGDSRFEYGLLSRWTKEEVAVFYYVQTFSCFLAMCSPSGQPQTLPVGSVLELSVGGRTFQSFGDNGIFPINGEMSEAMRNAPAGEASIKLNLESNAMNRSMVNAIGAGTVEAWKSIYTPDVDAGGQRLEIAALSSSTRKLEVEELVQRSITSVVSIKTRRGAGTGFLLSNTGLVLTNRHVVAGDDKPQVFLYDQATRTATVLRRDNIRDVALLKIDVPANAYRGLPLCFTDTAKVGSDVVIIGNPGGVPGINLAGSISRGIISGIRDSQNQTLIQTDAAINPGNSGGPMLNRYGTVVGIVNSKLVRQGVEGLGFAVRIGEALTSLGITVNVPRESAADTCGNLLAPTTRLKVQLRKVK